ncbi:hypothetical protein U728_1241 [Clostridium botulinum 202F]|nr:hypothetical protein U728_1241 [Clostridium botulinum 202F]KON13677.1 viral A-type inclusion protein [Clostridium botulinum]MBY6987223.1 viral A-type inclusion protein [Clostridium botulinum]
MIHELQTGILDINNKYDINFSCKQLDDIILKLIIYDKSLPADLSNYNVRLKTFKADQVPLIQNTNITIKGDFVTIKADKQLTTTNGIVKAELQFINKTTLEKKSTFYINIEIVASVLDVDGIVSTPTCTILEEIDHKLDEIENIGEVLDEAKEVRDTLTNKTIPTATSINSKLETNIGNASTKITEVESIISSASIKIEEVETCINNADFSKKELDLSKTNADISKENLDIANVQAEKNIEELNKIGDAKDLAAKVETNKSNIENLQEKVEDNTSQLKENAKDIQDLSNMKINKKVRYYMSDDISKGANPNNILDGSFLIAHELNPTPNGFCYYEQFFYSNVSEDANRIQYVTSYNGDLRHFIRRYFNGSWEVTEISTVDDTGWIDLPLASGITVDGNITPQYRRVNNQVFICGSILGVDSTNKTVATLPVGFRPSRANYYVGFTNGTYTNAIRIDTNGNIIVQSNASGTYDPARFATLGTNFIT